ncbi:MAG: hypothetical protein L0L66_05065, partial [Bifidobacterium crudilactis]|nr:hypothetical protein [Bifidobacterium crudilactis]
MHIYRSPAFACLQRPYRIIGTTRLSGTQHLGNTWHHSNNSTTALERLLPWSTLSPRNADAPPILYRPHPHSPRLRGARNASLRSTATTGEAWQQSFPPRLTRHHRRRHQHGRAS